MTDPTTRFDPEIAQANIHRLGAAKNRRAPAGALEKTPAVGSAAVLGRINVTTDPTTRLDHANAPPERSPAGGGQECPRSRRRARGNTGGRERGRPRPHQRDDRPYDPFRSCKSGARTLTGWGSTNNVSVPISAFEGFLRRLRQPPIGTWGYLRTTPLSGRKTQTASLSLYFQPAPGAADSLGGC